MAPRIDDLPIGGPAAVGDPHTGTGAHDGLQRGDNTTSRDLHLKLLVLPIVDVRFTIGDDQHFITGEMVVRIWRATCSDDVIIAVILATPPTIAAAVVRRSVS